MMKQLTVLGKVICLSLLTLCLSAQAQASKMEEKEEVERYSNEVPKAHFLFTKPSPKSFFAEGYESYDLDPPYHCNRTADVIKKQFFAQGWSAVPLDFWFGYNEFFQCNILLRKTSTFHDFFVFMHIAQGSELTKKITTQINSILLSENAWDYPEKTIIQKVGSSFGEMSWMYVAAHLRNQPESTYGPTLMLPVNEDKKHLFSLLKEHPIKSVITRAQVSLNEDQTYSVFYLSDHDQSALYQENFNFLIQPFLTLQ